MGRININSDCENLKAIIDDLKQGKETCRIEDEERFTLGDVFIYLRGFLEELNDLNDRLIKSGNTPELLKEVHDKYTELWLFQLSFYVESLPKVIGGLMYYPRTESDVWGPSEESISSLG